MVSLEFVKYTYIYIYIYTCIYIEQGIYDNKRVATNCYYLIIHLHVVLNLGQLISGYLYDTIVERVSRASVLVSSKRILIN